MRVKLSKHTSVDIYEDIKGIYLEDDGGNFYLTPPEAYRLMELYIHVLTDEEWERLKEIAREV